MIFNIPASLDYYFILSCFDYFALVESAQLYCRLRDGLAAFDCARACFDAQFLDLLGFYFYSLRTCPETIDFYLLGLDIEASTD